jgi:hypothetical protein
MKYTPYDNHTTDELVQVVLNSENPSDLELALMERIEMLQNDIEDLEQYRATALKKLEAYEGTPV